MRKVIDISEHNGEIDFAKVRMAGINDVIIRIGWIGNKNNHTIDKNFNTNYLMAKRYGLNVGIYVYSYCKSIEALKSGSEWVKNLLINKTLELPVFLDLEDSSITSCGKENLTNHAIEFCKYFENLGFKAGVYANKDWFTRLVDPQKIEKYKIWLAEWFVSKPSVSYKVDFWQYTDKEKVSGINGNVDCSQCFYEENENSNNQNINIGDDEELKIYKNGSTPEPVYSDTNLTNKIGSLNPREQCECLGTFQNRAIVRYKVDNKQNYKIGFVKWLGGIQK